MRRLSLVADQELIPKSAFYVNAAVVRCNIIAARLSFTGERPLPLTVFHIQLAREGMADQSKYRGYIIYLAAESDVWNTPGGENGWRASGVPSTPNLPILPRASFGLFASREEALARCKKLIDSLLAD